MKQLKIDLKEGENTIEIIEDTDLEVLFVGKNEDSITSKMRIVHQKPNLKSRIKIKAVVFDKSRFDFEGLLRIEKGATGTDTYLKIDCLVMGDDAYARAIPSLEILESEVKGGHGATIGYLSPDMVFYLKSKGLDREQAEDVLVRAFLKK